MRAKNLKALRWTGIALLAAILGFALTGWIGSAIPRNGDWQEADPALPSTVAILVGTNGIHTEIAMPLVTTEKDWRSVFPVRDIADRSRPYTHVAVSWGERKFFLETPSWSDVNPITVLRAMTGGEGVLHIAHYVRPAPSETYRIVHLRSKEYRALARAIETQLAPAATRETLPGYGDWDVFYTAQGTYHIGNTCNQWTSDQLAAAGLSTGIFTPFSGGVMKWVPERPLP